MYQQQQPYYHPSQQQRQQSNLPIGSVSHQQITVQNNFQPNMYPPHPQQQYQQQQQYNPYGSSSAPPLVMNQQQQPPTYGQPMNQQQQQPPMHHQPNYGQVVQPTTSGGSITVSTTQQHPHSFYYPYYSYQTTTNTNIPIHGQPQQGSVPPPQQQHVQQPYGQPQPPMNPPSTNIQPMNPYGQPMMTPPPVVNSSPLTVASVQTSITFSNTTTPTPTHNSIKYQINPPLHIAPHYSLRGELVLKTQHPFCVRAMHHSPTIIIADSNTSKITLLDSSSGMVRETFDVTTGCVGGVGVDPMDDSFYIVSGQKILKYGANGVHLGTFGENFNLKKPYGLTVDDQGFVYICDLHQHIFVMTREGIMVRYISVEKPYDIFFDKLNQTLVVTDQDKDCVRVLTKEGLKIRKIGGKGNAKGQFISPSGVCVNAGSNIIVADYGNHRVQVFDCMGRFLYSMGNKGKLESEFDLPRSVCTDINGNLFVAEYGNSRVQIFRKM